MLLSDLFVLIGAAILSGVGAGFAVFIIQASSLLGTIGKLKNKFFGGNRPEFKDEYLDKLANGGFWQKMKYELLTCSACLSFWLGGILSSYTMWITGMPWKWLPVVWLVSATTSVLTREKLGECSTCKKASDLLRSLKEKKLGKDH